METEAEKSALQREKKWNGEGKKKVELEQKIIQQGLDQSKKIFPGILFEMFKNKYATCIARWIQSIVYNTLNFHRHKNPEGEKKKKQHGETTAAKIQQLN